ncbi:hypothetical protein QQF64_033962 [Cirrhinus molitorella]|uniref:Uncharacterized protein n=1 Tax=Cirrhinus molitorella TaxID=172907 RepID=A0ABR3MVE3_9TELE
MEEKEEGLNLTFQDPTSLRLSGKLVTLKKPGGVTLKTKHSIVRIKPYRRSQTGKVQNDCSGISVSNGSTESNSSFNMPPCTVAPKLSPQPSVNKLNDPVKLQEDSVLQRHSVIQFAPKKLDQTYGYIKEVKLTQTDEEPAIKFPTEIKHISEEQEVMKVWAASISGQVEAVVGPYKLYDSSYHTLQGTEWVSDEVIDAYLHLVIKKQRV